MADAPQQKCKCGWLLPVAVTLAATVRMANQAEPLEARVACPVCRTNHKVPVDGVQTRMF